jgi:hypothetical protein
MSTGMPSLNKRGAFAVYAQSLLWVGFFVAVTVGVMNIVQLTLIDFIHGNPHRPQANAMFMMAVYTPIYGIIAFVWSFLIFALPQFFQAALIDVFDRIFGSQARFVVLLVLPLTVVLTWYSFEYLTPADFTLGIDKDPNANFFQQGLSSARYWKTLAVQAPMTLFSFLYFDASLRGNSKKAILVAALTVAIVIGLCWGHIMAQNQFQFL